MTERRDAHSTPETGAAESAAPAPGPDHFEEAPMTESPDQTTDDQTTDQTADQAADVNTEAVNDPDGRDAVSSGTPQDHDAAAADADSAAAEEAEHPDTRLAAERLEDLQRLQAEYVNYKRRVDRDRALVQEKAVADVLESMLPVMDDIHAAREHGDLSDGPFAAIADKLEGNLGKFGLERFGAVGESFDPTVHEALLHQEWDGSVEAQDSAATTIVMVLQPGYRTGDRVIRPARVAVADPA